MPPKMFLACCFLALTVSGCLVSEQIGEPVGQGRNRRPADDVAIHFDTDFNKAVLFARSAALLGFGLWVFSAWGMKPGSILVGGAAVFASLLFVARDYPVLTDYRLEVAAGGLTLKIPPDLDTVIPWSSIDEVEIEGFEYSSISTGNQFEHGNWVSTGGIELPDWKTMTLRAGGQSYLIQLDALSIEHRQIFFKALWKRGQFVEID